MSDTTTIDRPAEADGLPSGGTTNGAPVSFEKARERSESIAIFAAVFAAIGVLTSLFAVGLSVRAVQRADSIENPPAAVILRRRRDGRRADPDPDRVLDHPSEISVPAGSVLTSSTTAPSPTT